MREKETEIIDKLFLELAQFTTAKTAKQLKSEKRRDKFGLALLMIQQGCADPAVVAAKALSDD